MTTSEQVAGEAQMTADNLVHKAVCEWIRDDAPVAVRMTLRPEHLHALVRRVAALRAQPERGAEEMKHPLPLEHLLLELIRKVHIDNIGQLDLRMQDVRIDSKDVGDWALTLTQTRALPLHPDKDEGGGR